MSLSLSQSLQSSKWGFKVEANARARVVTHRGREEVEGEGGGGGKKNTDDDNKFKIFYLLKSFSSPSHGKAH